jgi:hypothetical protein
MIEHLHITVVADNLVRGAGRLGEHGWAVWLEADDRRVLFDTGQGQVLIPNLEALQLDLSRADAIVLSHGHYATERNPGACKERHKRRQTYETVSNHDRSVVGGWRTRHL